MADLVRFELEEGIACLFLDDGKANAIGPDMLRALNAALDRAEEEARAVVLVGRPGRFSAGFDLSVMGAGGEPMRELVASGAEFALRLLASPKPVVASCTGHAMAMGAVLLLSCDARVGARGAFKIGLNEVAIGLPLPHFARELARARLSKRHLLRAAVQSEIYTPEGALDAGYLDALAGAEEVLDAGRRRAAALAGLDPRAFAVTKAAFTAPLVEEIRAGMADDLAKELPGS